MKRWPASVFLLTALAILSVHSAPDAVPLSLKVAVVQMRSTRNVADNLQRIKKLISQCATNGARVVVFPECAVSGYFENVVTNLSSDQIERAHEEIARACREVGVYAVVGSPWREGKKLFNSAIIFSPSGTVVERYHKVQLAEAWPDAGDHLSVFKIDGVPCSVIICHDERYPELVRLPVLAGARVVFYISHESGVSEKYKIGPYRAQIQARAVENSIYIVHANAPANSDQSGSHGQSRVIAPDGNILQEATIAEQDVLYAELPLAKATRQNATKSITRGPLQDWWKDGLRRVRIIE